LQFQADISNTIVQKPSVMETTALGAAYLAGLAVDYWKDLEDIRSNFLIESEYEPSMDNENRTTLLNSWHKAIETAQNWEQ
jgi:glycerol kinase